MRVELQHMDGSRSLWEKAKWVELGRLENGKRYIKVMEETGSIVGRKIRVFVWPMLRRVVIDGRTLDGMKPEWAGGREE